MRQVNAAAQVNPVGQGSSSRRRNSNRGASAVPLFAEPSELGSWEEQMGGRAEVDNTW